MGRTRTTGTKAAVAFGVTAGVLGGAMVGGVLGVPGLSSASDGGAAVVRQVDDRSDESTGDESTGDELTTEDERGVELRARMGERLRERLQPLVDEDTITSDQADAVADHLVTESPARGAHGGRFDDRPHRPGSFPGRGGLGGMDPGALAEVLGIDLDEIFAELRSGATLRELAGSLGVDVDQVVDAITDAMSGRLDSAVENGRLTQAEADERAADLTDRIEAFLDRGFPGRR